jgi:signal transduction histidine kinase
VLVLYGARRDAQALQVFEVQLRQLLTKALADRLDYYTEYLDSARFAAPAQQSALRQFLSRKYQGQRFDLIITPSDVDTAFVSMNHHDLFGDAAHLFSVSGEPIRDPRSTGVIARLRFDSTLKLVAALQPETRQVFVVSGASEYDKFYETLAREQFERFGGFTFTYLSGLAMSDLRLRVSQLPPDSVVYYLCITEDVAGQKFLPTEVIEGLSAAANVPVYSWHEAGMDRGIVGGSLQSVIPLARHLAERGLRILNGESPQAIPVVEVDANVTQIDWRQLRRWNLDARRIPEGSTVLFRELGVWERYRIYIIGAISLIALQLLLICGLVLSRTRRRKAEASLRASHVRIQDLAGRLITAQEVERRRIARELHDDVGQRLASFAITLSSLKRQVAGSPNGVGHEVETLHAGTLELSKDLRKLSHELHPGVLEHLGLEQALRTRCDAFSVESGVAVRVDIAPDVGEVHTAAALCLYRVGQETLQNVAKHARARTVRLSLSRLNGHLELRVMDDGTGFDGAAQHPGLGLVSLGERVRTLGGTLAIESSPGQGTTVAVSLPMASPSAAGHLDPAGFA